MLLTYNALDSAGTPTRNSLEAPGVPEAVEQLRRRGLFVTHIAPERAPATAPVTRRARSAVPRLPLRVLTLFTRQMAMLLRAGSGIVPAMQAVARQMKPQHANILHTLVAELEDGTTLTDAMRKHPRTFDSVYCAIVAAGEASATLAEMFDRLSGIVGKRRAIRNRILGSLAYPVVLIALCVKIILVLLFFVLPRFADMFKQLGVTVPAVTQALLTTGAFLRAYWPWLGGAAVAGAAALAWTVWDSRGRRWASEMLMNVPLLGRLRIRLMMAQMLRTLGMLLESGVGVLDTLELVRSSSWTRRFYKLFDDMDRAVTSGGQLSEAFLASGFVDPSICQAVRTGEDSGKLGEAMTYCADVLDETNTEMLNVAAKLIEPAILISMGIVVGGVAISLFVPLFDLTSAIR